MTPLVDVNLKKSPLSLQNWQFAPENQWLEFAFPTEIVPFKKGTNSWKVPWWSYNSLTKISLKSLSRNVTFMGVEPKIGVGPQIIH